MGVLLSTSVMMRPASDPVTLLCHLLRLGDQGVAKAALGASAAFLDALVAGGLVVNDGVPETVLCSACDTHHLADVEPAPNGRYGWHCPDAGFVVADLAQVEVFASRMETAATRLREVLTGALGHPRRVVRKLDDAQTWILGAWDIAGGWTTIVVSRGLESAAEGKRAADAISLLPPNDAGIVLSIDDDLVGFAVPNGFVTLPLNAVFEANDEGQLKVDKVLLERAAKLLLAAGKAGRSGRPSSKDQVFAVLDALVRDGASRAGLEPRTVRRCWGELFPAEKAPATSTVRKHLAAWNQAHRPR
jgi:hypothetical protein